MEIKINQFIDLDVDQQHLFTQIRENLSMLIDCCVKYNRSSKYEYNSIIYHFNTFDDRNASHQKLSCELLNILPAVFQSLKKMKVQSFAIELKNKLLSDIQLLYKLLSPCLSKIPKKRIDKYQVLNLIYDWWTNDKNENKRTKIVSIFNFMLSLTMTSIIMKIFSLFLIEKDIDGKIKVWSRGEVIGFTELSLVLFAYLRWQFINENTIMPFLNKSLLGWLYPTTKRMILDKHGRDIDKVGLDRFIDKKKSNFYKVDKR